jgi:F-type H+-transporting ATPase subunit alpha
VEVLKQGQYEPLPVEKQILIIFAGTSGLLDDIDVEQVRRFETELYRFVDNAHPGVLQTIREKKILDDALRGQLTNIINEFKQRFAAEPKMKAQAG